MDEDKPKIGFLIIICLIELFMVGAILFGLYKMMMLSVGG